MEGGDSLNVSSVCIEKEKEGESVIYCGLVQRRSNVLCSLDIKIIKIWLPFQTSQFCGCWKWRYSQRTQGFFFFSDTIRCGEQLSVKNSRFHQDYRKRNFSWACRYRFFVPEVSMLISPEYRTDWVCIGLGIVLF